MYQRKKQSLTINDIIRIFGCFPKYSNRKQYNLKYICCFAGFKLHRYFYFTTNETLLKIWNGIGASGKWYNKFIPKHVWFLNIEICSLPHDFDYYIGGTELDKQKADKRFFYNIKRWIDINTDNQFLRKLRYISAYKYYLTVKAFGSNAFNYHN